MTGIFAENIETTKAAATGVADLSPKSSSISGIVESIRDIAKKSDWYSGFFILRYLLPVQSYFGKIRIE